MKKYNSVSRRFFAFAGALGLLAGCSSEDPVFEPQTVTGGNPDLTAPSVSGLADDPVAARAKNWSWGCSEASCTYRYVIDQSAATEPSGSYGGTVSASQNSGSGTYYLHVQAMDAAGNSSAVVHVSAVLDNTAPAVPSGLALVTPATSPGNVATPVIRVSGVSGGDTIAIFSDASCATQMGSGVASGATIDLVSSALIAGETIFYARAADPLGNLSACSSANVSYTYDNGSVLVTGISNDGSPAQAKTWNWGCSKASCTYRFVIDTSAATDPAGAYGSLATATQNSGTGTYYLHVQAKDLANNESAVVHVSAELDNTAPGVPTGLALITPAASPGNLSQPVIRVSGVASGDTVGLYSDASCSTLKASGTASGATIDLTSSALSAGDFVFYAKAADALGNASSCSIASVAYTYDNAAPSVTGLSNDAIYTKSKSWSWGCSEASCTYRYLIDQLAATAPAGAYDGTVSASQGSGTGTYYLHVQALDAAGNASAVVHVSALLDNTVPSQPGAISGPTVNGGNWWNSVACTPLFNWTASTDAQSGIDRYEVAVGTSVGATDIANWFSTGTSTSKQFCGLSLVNGMTYHVTVRAIDAATNVSSLRQGSWIADAELPTTPPSIADGATSSSLTDTPTISWTASSDAISGFDHYEVAIGSSAGATDKMTWTSAGAVTSTSFGGLSFANGNTYYASVRAVDKAGNPSAVRQGDGWAVSGGCFHGTATYSFTGANQSFTLPANNCTSLTFQVWGGGGGSASSFGSGAYYVTQTATIATGTVLTVKVGGRGGYVIYDCGASGGAGGWPDGGGGIADNCLDHGASGGGGGSSSVLNGATVVAQAKGGNGEEADGVTPGGAGGGVNVGTATANTGGTGGNSAAAPCSGACANSDMDGMIHISW